MAKKNTLWWVLGVVGVIVVGYFALFPDALDILLFQQPASCKETPFQDECTCSIDEDKLSTPYGGFTRYFCEKTEKVIDPGIDGWEDTARSIAKSKIAEMYPECDMRLCDNGQAETSELVVLGLLDWERRRAHYECIDENGFRFTNADVDLVTGIADNIACANYADVVQEVSTGTPADLELNEAADRPEEGYVRFAGSLSSSCEDTDNGIGTFTVFASRGNVEEWIIWTGGYFFENTPDGRRWITQDGEQVHQTSTIVDENQPLGSCSIVDSTSDYAMIECDTECPHPSFSNKGVHAAGYYTESFRQTFVTE